MINIVDTRVRVGILTANRAGNAEEGCSVEPTAVHNSSIFIDVLVELIRLLWPASAWCLLFLLTCCAPLLRDCALRFEPAWRALNEKLRNDLLS
jgi:hypothetical protein